MLLKYLLLAISPILLCSAATLPGKQNEVDTVADRHLEGKREKIQSCQNLTLHKIKQRRTVLRLKDLDRCKLFILYDVPEIVQYWRNSFEELYQEIKEEISSNLSFYACSRTLRRQEKIFMFRKMSLVARKKVEHALYTLDLSLDQLKGLTWRLYKPSPEDFISKLHTSKFYKLLRKNKHLGIVFSEIIKIKHIKYIKTIDEWARWEKTELKRDSRWIRVRQELKSKDIINFELNLDSYPCANDEGQVSDDGWKMTANVWKEEQCAQISSHFYNDLEKCKAKCLSTRKLNCTAMMYTATEPGLLMYPASSVQCILLACPRPVPAPHGVVKFYSGYYLASKGEEKERMDFDSWSSYEDTENKGEGESESEGVDEDEDEDEDVDVGEFDDDKFVQHWERSKNEVPNEFSFEIDEESEEWR